METKKETLIIIQRFLSYVTVLFLGIISFFSIKLYEKTDITSNRVEDILLWSAEYQVRVHYLEKQIDLNKEEIKEIQKNIQQNNIENSNN